MKVLSDNLWEMSTQEKREVQHTGLLNGKRVDVSKLIWSEYNPGTGRCWFRSV